MSTLEIPLEAVIESYLHGSNRLLLFINQVESAGGRGKPLHPAKRGLVEVYDSVFEPRGASEPQCSCDHVKSLLGKSKYLLGFTDFVRLAEGRRGAEPRVYVFTADITHYVVAYTLLMARYVAEVIGGKVFHVLLRDTHPGEALSEGGGEYLSKAILGELGVVEEVNVSGQGSCGDWEAAYRLSELVGGALTAFYQCGEETTLNYLRNLVFEEHGSLAPAMQRGLLALGRVVKEYGFPVAGSPGASPFNVYVGSLTYYFLVRSLAESLVLAGSCGLRGGAARALKELFGGEPGNGGGERRLSLAIVNLRSLGYLWEAVRVLYKVGVLDDEEYEDLIEGLSELRKHYYVMKGEKVSVEPLRKHAEFLREHGGRIREALRRLKSEEAAKALKVLYCDTIISGLSHPLDLLVVYRLMRLVRLSEGDAARRYVEVPRLGVKAKLRFSQRLCPESLKAIADSAFLEALARELEREASEWERLEGRASS